MAIQQAKATEFILDGIRRGRYPAGHPLPPVEDLARLVPCSTHAVRRSFRDLADRRIVRSVQRRGTMVLRKPALGRVTLLQSLEHHTNVILLDGVYRALVEAGYDVAVQPADLRSDLVFEQMMQDHEHHRAGDFLIALAPEVVDGDPELVRRFERYARPFSCRVYFTYEQPSVRLPASEVRVDPLKSARLVAEHLLALGHRRVGVLASAGPQEYLHMTRRADCFVELMEIAGATCLKHYYQDGLATDAFVARHRLTAYWEINDDAALALALRLERQGLRVPRDVSVVGGNDTPLATSTGLGLTSVNLNPEAVGAAMVDLLETHRRAGTDWTPQQRLVEPRLTVRDSTAPRSAR